MLSVQCGIKRNKGIHLSIRHVSIQSLCCDKHYVMLLFSFRVLCNFVFKDYMK